MLNAEEHLKVKDLCRVYGASELCDYLSVARNIVDLALKQNSEIAEPATKRIRSGIRLYWKSWMGEYRATPKARRSNPKALDKHYHVISIEEATKERP
jgi:hypothetical protein